MNGQWASATVALGMVAAPASVRLAEVSNHAIDDSSAVQCVLTDRVVVERRKGGERDVVAKLARGTEVDVLESDGDLSRVRYPWKRGVRVGWVESQALGACDEDAAGSDEREPQSPAPSNPRESSSNGSFSPFGTPRGSVPGGLLLQKSAYNCYHDPELRYCRWVEYCFHPTGRSSPRYSGFYAEPSLPTSERAVPQDYDGAYKTDRSGFDRGHMAPDATLKVFGKDAQRETYSLANVTPQYTEMNQGIWRQLEAAIRSWGTTEEPVCVETGPVFEKDRPVKRLTGPNQLAIPHAYFAIITQGEGPNVISFSIPNEPLRRSIADVMDYAKRVDDVELLVGFDFLPDLEDSLESKIEGERPEEIW